MFLELPPNSGRKYSDIKMNGQKKVFAFKLNELEFETIRNLFIHYDWDFDNALLAENKTFEAGETYKRCARGVSQEALSGPSSYVGYGDDAAAAADNDDDGRQNSVATSNNDSVLNSRNGNQAARSDSNNNGDNHCDNNDGNGDNDGDNDDDNDDDDDGDDDGSDGESDDSADFDGCRECLCNPCVTTHRQAWLGNAVAPHNRNADLRKKRYKHFWQMLDRRQAWIHPSYLRKKAQLLNRQDDTIVYTVREIMPRCVIDLVRSLFPNPPGRPYMGHKWQ